MRVTRALRPLDVPSVVETRPFHSRGARWLVGPSSAITHVLTVVGHILSVQHGCPGLVFTISLRQDSRLLLGAHSKPVSKKRGVLPRVGGAWMRRASLERR